MECHLILTSLQRGGYYIAYLCAHNAPHIVLGSVGKVGLGFNLNQLEYIGLLAAFLANFRKAILRLVFRGCSRDSDRSSSYVLP